MRIECSYYSLMQLEDAFHLVMKACNACTTAARQGSFHISLEPSMFYNNTTAMLNDIGSPAEIYALKFKRMF